MSGRELGGYRLGRKLGEGGMAAVYIAYPSGKTESVAVKLVHSRVEGEEFRDRFLREVKVIAELVHRNIVEFKDWGEQDGKLYLVMELVEGETLTRKLREDIPLSEALGYLVAVAEALEYAHKKGVLHRDVKPENVMVTGRGQVKVMDFGLAKKHDATTLTATGAIFGTPAYIPPEQAKSETVAETGDQYSFGVMAFQLLTGRLPFDSEEPLNMILKHVQESPPSVRELRPEIPEDLSSAVLRMLSKDPVDRFTSMGEVRELLADALDQCSR